MGLLRSTLKYGTRLSSCRSGLPFWSSASAMRWAASGFSVMMSVYFSIFWWRSFSVNGCSDFFCGLVGGCWLVLM